MYNFPSIFVLYPYVVVGTLEPISFPEKAVSFVFEAFIQSRIIVRAPFLLFRPEHLLFRYPFIVGFELIFYFFVQPDLVNERKPFNRIADSIFN
jgi:hypothetical protein